MFRHFLELMAFVFLTISCQQKNYYTAEPPSIIPQPQDMSVSDGVLVLKKGVTLVVKSEEEKDIAEYLKQHLAALGIASTTSSKKPSKNYIHLKLSSAGAGHPESYTLKTTTSGVEVNARTGAGLFYGVQSLIQMLPSAKRNVMVLPVVEIRDQPRFRWRGMHLDVCRHFFPVSFIKKYLDLMAFYKMNTFHWHLTEDQGWRIEIKKYPKLTEIGSVRKETIVAKNFDPYVGDGEPYGGYYTQEEVKEIVAYAEERHITIVPEIEMPGHSLAALAAYPELACTEGPFEVGTQWGVYEDIYCPSEKTFQFLEDVLTEVVDLFPGPYVHIGGDEAPKTRWKESKLAQEVIKRENLKGEFELQSYFIRRIEKFLISKNRKLIGWDEILEGGLAPEATVMSWRGEEGGIEAAEQGHDVVMTPGFVCYFDHYQGDPEKEPLAIGGHTTLKDVYDYEPVPGSLSDDKRSHVLGAQANVWTEYMKTSDHVEYMVFPRMLALSETVWSKEGSKDWERFIAKLPKHFDILDTKKVNYRKPDQ